MPNQKDIAMDTGWVMLLSRNNSKLPRIPKLLPIMTLVNEVFFLTKKYKQYRYSVKPWSGT